MNSCESHRKSFGVHEDGEYTLGIGLGPDVNSPGNLTTQQQSLVKIYCADMNASSSAKEYVTLQEPGDHSSSHYNYFEIYDKALPESTSSRCRLGPRYGAACAHCANHSNVVGYGFTSFAKVRLNLTTLTIIGQNYFGFSFQNFKWNLQFALLMFFYCCCCVDDDFTFAKTMFGSPVKFGSAGDCFSSLPNCQQVTTRQKKCFAWKSTFTKSKHLRYLFRADLISTFKALSGQ